MTIRIAALALAGLGLLGLAACGEASAVETRERPMQAASLDGASGAEPMDAVAAAQPAEKPAVTSTRNETADAKVTRLYERNGSAFGAKSAEDYADKIEAFTRRPPKDAETVKRANGDTLIYQASTNTFAVVARNGTPRTMFKPDDGPAYWAEQKERAPTFGQRRSSSRDEG